MSATMTAAGISAELARELMVRAIAERGEDFIYQPHMSNINLPICVYQKDGKPDCLIGLMLSYIGPIPPNNAGSAYNAVKNLYPHTPHKVLLALGEAQRRQDAQSPWGVCLARFDEAMARLLA
jgi:hypothetical protein